MAVDGWETGRDGSAVADITFTQAQLDVLVKAYAEGKVSGSVTVEGRSFSWNYGSGEEMWSRIQRMKQVLSDSASTSARARHTLVSFDRGY